MNSMIDQMHLLVLHIGRECCHADWNCKDISSPFTRIYYVTAGHAQIELPGRTQDLHPGHMYIIPAFTPHSYVCREEFEHYYIHIYNESASDILEDYILPTEIQAGEAELTLIRRLHELCPGMELAQPDPRLYDNHSLLMQRELYARIESRGLIYMLLAGFMRTPNLQEGDKADAALLHQQEEDRARAAQARHREHTHQGDSLHAGL